MGFSALIAVTLCVLCIVIVLYDLKFMRIPDWISICIVGVFCIAAVFGAIEGAIWVRLLSAAVMFVVCFALFAARIMGGGDTKVIPALWLFVPVPMMSPVVLLFALCLLASIIAVLLARRLFNGGDSAWAVLNKQKLPMGVAIGATGVISQIVPLI